MSSLIIWVSANEGFLSSVPNNARWALYSRTHPIGTREFPFKHPLCLGNNPCVYKETITKKLESWKP